jgi:hypothetical protein
MEMTENHGKKEQHPIGIYLPSSGEMRDTPLEARWEWPFARALSKHETRANDVMLLLIHSR